MTPRPEHLGLGDPLLRVTLAGKAVIGVDRGEVAETFVNGVGWLGMPAYISSQTGSRSGHPWFPEEEGFLLHLWDLHDLDLPQMAAVLRRGLGGIRTKLGQLLIQRARP